MVIRSEELFYALGQAGRYRFMSREDLVVDE